MNITRIDVTKQNNSKMNSLKSPQKAAQKNPSFSRLPEDVKTFMLSPLIRTILKKQHNIDSKELRALDESNLKFTFLKDSVPELGLTEYAGLVLNPPGKSYLPRVAITEPGFDLTTTGPQFFAYCVKKALDLEKTYRTGLDQFIKDFAQHPANKARKKAIDKIERPIKNVLKDYRDLYNSGNGEQTSELSRKLTNFATQEQKIDAKYQPDLDKFQANFEKGIAGEWKAINEQEMPDSIMAVVADRVREAEKKASHARVKERIQAIEPDKSLFY